ncbi:MAG: guanylate kinase [Candidatus Magasanikbacteria bacterium]|jgi:guanylate kinase
MPHQGLLVVISSPSGGGKDVIISALVKKFNNSAKLITTTSRSPRPEDKEGVTYYFVSKEDFEEKIKMNEMVEYNFYANNYYGVTKTELKNKQKNFNSIFTNVDVHGRKNLISAGFKNLSIFLMPENLDDLKTRISRRGGLSDSEIEQRLQTAKQEIDRANEYDFQVINKNGKLPETIDNVAKIITKQLSSQLQT